MPKHVHLVLDLDGPLREARVLVDECTHGVVEHGDREFADLGEELVGDGGLRAAEEQDLACDALRVVPDALQLQVDLDRRVGEAEVAGHRLLAQQELDAEAVDLLLQLVDALVPQDDRVGQLQAPLLQGLEAVAECPVREVAHLGHLAPDAVDVPLEGLFVVSGHFSHEIKE